MSKEDRANEIADKANECCGRSDTFRADIYKLALEHLTEIEELAYSDAFHNYPE